MNFKPALETVFFCKCKNTTKDYSLQKVKASELFLKAVLVAAQVQNGHNYDDAFRQLNQFS